MTKVFVYGTLKQGYGNHRLLNQEGSEFLGTFISKDSSFTMSCCGFPFVNRIEEGGNKFSGELYEVTEEVLSQLDSLEGYNPKRPDDSWYRREEIELNNGDFALTYLNNQRGARVIEPDHGVLTWERNQSWLI